MGKRLISTVMLAAVLLLPCFTLADAEPSDIAVVLLMDYHEDVEGNIDQESLLDALHVFVTMAELQGRDVTIYGPCTGRTGKSIGEQTFFAYQDGMWNNDFPNNHKRIVQYTLKLLDETESMLFNKHLIFLIGNMQDQNEYSDEIEGLNSAAQVDVIKLTDEAIPDDQWGKTFTNHLDENQPDGTVTYSSLTDDASLTQMMISLLFGNDAQGNPNLRMYDIYHAPGMTDNAQPEEGTVDDASRETAETDEAALESSVTKDPAQKQTESGETTPESSDGYAVSQGKASSAALTDEMPENVLFPILPQLYDSAFLYIGFSGEWQDLQIVNPRNAEDDSSDDQVYTLSLTESSDDVWSGIPVQHGALFSLKELKKFIADDPSSSFEDWHLEINDNIACMIIYYDTIEYDAGTPILKFVAEEKECLPEGSNYTFNDPIERHKGEQIQLKLNDDHPSIQHQIRLDGLDALKLSFTTNDNSVEQTDDVTGCFSTDKKGAYTVTAELQSHGVTVATQTYHITVKNQSPKGTGKDIPAAKQNLYWEENQKLSFDLTSFCSDPDGDTLHWTLADQPKPGLDIQIKDNQLNLTHTNEKPDGEPVPYTFSIIAHDGDGGTCKLCFTLEWRSLEYDLSQVDVLADDMSFDETLVKYQEAEISFAFTLNGEPLDSTALNFLRDNATIYVKEANGALDTLEAKWDESTERFTANLTVRSDGDYTFGWSIISNHDDVQLDNRNALHSFPDSKRTVTNAKPSINNLQQPARLDWHWHWSLPSEQPSTLLDEQADRALLSVLSSDAFIDSDNTDANDESLTYKVNVYHSQNSDGEPLIADTVSSLPYAFSPNSWGYWTVKITAVDPDGAESDPIILSYHMASLVVLTMIIAAVLAMLAAIVWFILWLRKPRFAASAMLSFTIDNCESVELRLGGWKERAMPLNRVVPSLRSTLLSKAICMHLGKIYVQPTKDGFILVDKNHDTILTEQLQGQIGQPVVWTMDDHSLSLTLSDTNVSN